MVKIEDFGEFEMSWCPGCGNFSILKALKQALTASQIPPHKVLHVSGIGQAAKAPHYMRANMFNGLHGRSLSSATGARMVNTNLHVIVESGDGCIYAEGGNHFLATLRRNVDLTLLVHNNQIYGLTKGQASPTSDEGFATKFQPDGVTAYPFNPVAVAVTMKTGFVARGFSGEIDHLAGLIQEAIRHRGLSMIDILQPCVSFNKVNTFAWYKQRCYKLEQDHDPTDWESALKKALEWGDRIPIGILYRNKQKAPFEERFPVLRKGPLRSQEVDRRTLKEILWRYA
ncbi:MAG TPA: thiamine pyrophosphate-dependent enzyme [bacterium]|nr:thiamine pyrophosphate-dependent enzyme [bacterium]HQO33623.1 thiamine pyrophosphate-dependent enzyme [bacterium]HQQ00258.1 thiamine pyrophosphate-dependent enzyme [bacterium]